MGDGDLVTVARTLPVGWRVKLPASWEVEPGAETSEVASLQATRWRGEGPPGAQPAGPPEPEALGMLALAVFARSAVARPREVAEPYLEALADGGLRVLGDDFVEEPCQDEGAGAFERSWLLRSAVTRSQALPGEVFCRVLRHERAWVLAGVLSPRAEDDPDAWTENRRALLVVTSTLKIKG